MIMCYSRTIHIQNIVLPPTSISYFRTKPSLPSSPIRNTARLAGTVKLRQHQRVTAIRFHPIAALIGISDSATTTQSWPKPVSSRCSP